MTLNYNVWQNDYSRYTCSCIHKKFFDFKKTTKHFMTARKCNARLDKRSFIQKFYMHMHPCNKFM